MSDERGQYEIYGRTAYERPLTHIQTITITQSLSQEVIQTVGNDEWVELVAIPTHALIHVVGESKPSPQES